MRRLTPYLLLSLLMVLCSCGGGEKSRSKLKIQASSVPQAEILEQVKAPLAEEGICLEIIVIDDYNIPNRALAEGEIDANFFQHKPFLEDQVKQFGYPICPLMGVHLEPMGLYTKNNKEVQQGNVIAIPNDPSNETRALLLLQAANLITLNKQEGYLTVFDIKENPLSLKFKEIDAAFLTRAFGDVDGAVIPTNYALLANLSPIDDAIFIEDASSPYVNIIAVRKEDLQKPDLLALKRLLRSEKIRLFIISKYRGTVTPLLKRTEDPASHPEPPGLEEDNDSATKCQERS
jgi:D-methionine transport system substrate-binding protein